MAFNLKEDELRFGISALGLEYKEHAVNDELLTRNSDGKMFYKRPDGNIVSYDSNEYTRDGIVSSLKNIINTSSAWASPTDEYIVYHTYDMIGVDIFSNISSEISMPEISISGKSNGIFIRLRPNNAVNACLAYIDTYRRFGESPLSDFASITYDVKINDEVTTLTSPVSTDKLVFIPLGNDAEVESATIKIKSISFDSLSNIISNLPTDTYNSLKSLNFENDKFELDKMDVISYVSKYSDISICDGGFPKFDFRYAFPVNIISDEYSVSDGIVISEEKPTYKCIWGRVIPQNNV